MLIEPLNNKYRRARPKKLLKFLKQKTGKNYERSIYFCKPDNDMQPGEVVEKLWYLFVNQIESIVFQDRWDNV